jgi:PAS domain S-box-containing protein
MSSLPFSRTANGFVWAVVAAGAVVVTYSVVAIVAAPPSAHWLLLAAFTFASSPFSIRIPSVPLTISVTETFVFASALLFGPAAAALTVAVDGLIVSTSGAERSLQRTLFNVAEPAVSIWVAAQCFYWLSGAGPLFGQSVAMAEIFLPLLVLTTTFFLINALLQARAVAFEMRVSPWEFFRPQAPHVVLNFAASLSLVVLVARSAENFVVMAVGVLAPLLLVAFVSSKMVSERRETQEALEESESRFRELAENITEVLWMMDAASHRLLYVSPAYERIWGRHPDAIVEQGAGWQEMIHVEDRGRAVDALLHRAPIGEMDVEYRIVRDDTTVRWIHDRAFPVTDADGHVRRIAGIAEDVTERRSLEQQLIQSQKMEGIGRMAGGIAHDFNNLLTVIMGFSDLVLMQIGQDDPARGDAQQIRHAVKKAAGLTNQLLAFSRQQVLKMTRVDLNAVVRDVQRMLQRVLGEDLIIDTVLQEDVKPITADPSQLEQILVNFAVNARDAMPRGGTFTVETSQSVLAEPTIVGDSMVAPGAYTVMTVRDTGSGMDEATRARIFEPFFTTKAHGKGSGLGLASVYGTIKQLGGHIEVASVPGRGTCFTTYFPMATGAVDEIEYVDGEVSDATGHETVLLVEDDDLVRAFVQNVLVRAGYLVLEAAGPETALGLASRHEDVIDLVLTDIVMPGMNGEQMVEVLRRQRPEVKVLYMSGYNDTSVFVDGVPPTLLDKPFTRDVLLGRVRSVLHADDARTRG